MHLAKGPVLVTIWMSALHLVFSHQPVPPTEADKASSMPGWDKGVREASQWEAMTSQEEHGSSETDAGNRAG